MMLRHLWFRGMCLGFLLVSCQDDVAQKPGDVEAADDESCETGARGCPCYRNMTCDDDLECVDMLCVRTGTGDDDDTDDDSPDDDTDDDSSDDDTDDDSPDDDTDDDSPDDDDVPDGQGGEPSNPPGPDGAGGDGPVVNPPQGSAGSQVVLPEPEPDAPVIISLGSNISVMGPGDTLTISALVTDPDGIDDLIGGTLIDKETGATYGALASSAAEGAYAITLSFGTIHAAHPVDTAPGGGERTFLARFSDVAGHLTTGELTILFRCETTALAICDGVCKDTERDDQHCGECNNQCDDVCLSGGCYVTVNYSVPERCESVCSAEGLACTERPLEDGFQAGTAYYSRNSSVFGVYISSCDEFPANEAAEEPADTPSPFSHITCLCVDGEPVDVPMGGSGGMSNPGPSNGGGAGGSNPTTANPLIDDFATCDGDISPIDGRDGFWYTFADEGITYVPNTEAGDPAVGPDLAFGTQDCAAWVYGDCNGSPSCGEYGGIGFTLRDDEGYYDASAFGGLSFLYQGAELYVVMHSSTGTFGIYIAESSSRVRRSFSFYDLSVSGSTPSSAVFDPSELIKVEFTATDPEFYVQAIFDVQFVP